MFPGHFVGFVFFHSESAATWCRASEVAFPILFSDVVRGARGNRHNRKRRLVTTLRDEGRAICDKDVFHVMDLIEAIDDACPGVVSHPRRPALVDVLAENAELGSGRLRVLKLQGIEDFENVLPHCLRHGALVFAVARVDVERRNAPRVFFFAVELDVVVIARQALALGHHAEVVRNLLAHSPPELRAKAGRGKSLSVKLLAGVAVETVAAKEVPIPVVPYVDVLRDQEPARVAGRLARGGLERQIGRASCRERV